MTAPGRPCSPGSCRGSPCRRLGLQVKLAGATISCEGAPLRGFSGSGVWRRTPHVQSFALALDRQALALLAQDGRVLRCYDNRWAARSVAAGSSAAADASRSELGGVDRRGG
jgi:hypothetical protein